MVCEQSFIGAWCAEAEPNHRCVDVRGKWNPENELGPVIQQLRRMGQQIALVFSEPVTVKGKPQLKMSGGGVANYVSGSGADTLLFELASDSNDEVRAVDLNDDAMIACEASATLRADLSLRGAQKFTTKLSEPFRGPATDGRLSG